MRILVVRLSSLGDVVHAIPAVAGLRRRFPDARIDWLVDDRYRQLVELVPVVDAVVPVSRRLAAGVAAAVVSLRARQYDVAVDLQGLVKSALLARLSRASRVIGFPRRWLREGWASWLYTEQPEVGDPVHIVEKNLALVERLGVVPHPWEFPIREVATDIVTRTVAEDQEPGRPFALLNPGAAWESKRWNPVGYGELAGRLHETHGLRSVVIWGPGERERAEQVVKASAGTACLAPATTIADLVALARAAVLMVSADTGPLHLASAVGTPVVGVYGPSNPRRNGPWSGDDLVVSRFEDCACQRVRSREGVIVRRCLESRPCMSTIGVDEVANAVTRRLGGTAR